VQLLRFVLQRAFLIACAGAVLPRRRPTLLGEGQPWQLAKQVITCSSCAGSSTASAQPLTCLRRLRGLREGDVEYFRSLTPQELSSLIVGRDEDGRTLFHTAAANGHMELLELLAGSGATKVANKQDDEVILAAVLPPPSHQRSCWAWKGFDQLPVAVVVFILLQVPVHLLHQHLQHRHPIKGAEMYHRCLVVGRMHEQLCLLCCAPGLDPTSFCSQFWPRGRSWLPCSSITPLQTPPTAAGRQRCITRWVSPSCWQPCTQRRMYARH